VQEERLDELEAKLAFAEDLIETLNQTVIRQQRQLDSLQEQLRLLLRQMRDSQSDAEPTTLREEIPPHY
jgi:SlyX protein